MHTYSICFGKTNQVINLVWPYITFAVDVSMNIQNIIVFFFQISNGCTNLDKKVLCLHIRLTTFNFYAALNTWLFLISFFKI